MTIGRSMRRRRQVDEVLSARKAQDRTGINDANFARFPNARLNRITIDWLLAIGDCLG